MSILPGQTQYLSYRNGFLRGYCVSEACVQVTWAGGFVQTMKAEDWGDRVFLQRPDQARLLTSEQAQAAEAFFARRAGARCPGVVTRIRDIDPTVLGQAFLDTMGDPQQQWRDRPLPEFLAAMADRLARTDVQVTPRAKGPAAP